MKLADAAAKVDKSEENRVLLYGEHDLHSVLEVVEDYNHPWGQEKRLQAFWYERWLCTDTQVGTAILFLDQELMGLRFQSARKNPVTWTFVSMEAAQKVRQYLLSLSPIEDLEIETPDEEIHRFSQFTGDRNYYCLEDTNTQQG